MNILGKIPESTAPSGWIDWNGFLKVVRLAIIGALAAAAFAFLDFFSKAVLQFDFGPFAPFIIPALTALFEFLRRVIANYSQTGS